VTQVPQKCTGVPEEILNPETTWADKEDFDATLNKLAEMYIKNFKKFEGGDGFVSEDVASRILAAGPQV